jgi:hypothetical protein
MRLFAVRLIEDKQAVGFFWAADLTTLWWMIDSICDPGLCEYHPIEDCAAITWQDGVKATLGAGNGPDETGESPALNELRRELTFDFALEDYVAREITAEWTKVPFADEPGSGSSKLYPADDEAKARTGRKHKNERKKEAKKKNENKKKANQ